MNTSYARGYGLSVATVGFLSSFTVLAKDEYGNEPFSGNELGSMQFYYYVDLNIFFSDVLTCVSDVYRR